MKYSVCLLCIVVSLYYCSCSNTYVMLKENPAIINADPHNATLVIYRSTSYKYDLIVSNYLNNQFIGQTSGKSYFVTRTKPGTYYLVGKSDYCSCSKITVDAGKVYYILQAIYPQEHHFAARLPDDFMKDEKDLTCYSVVSHPGTVYPAIKETELKKVCDQFDKSITTSVNTRPFFDLKEY